MKINKLKINAYGKLKDKEINFKNNINIIYGKNEAGKSTLLNFISNCFYGISKNKKGKDISDFERYMPWAGEDFSGKMEGISLPLKERPPSDGNSGPRSGERGGYKATYGRNPYLFAGT